MMKHIEVRVVLHYEANSKAEKALIASTAAPALADLISRTNWPDGLRSCTVAHANEPPIEVTRGDQ